MPRLLDNATFSMSFADGSFGSVHYLANGHKSFAKERLEVFCAGRILQLDNFRSLKGFRLARLRYNEVVAAGQGQPCLRRGLRRSHPPGKPLAHPCRRTPRSHPGNLRHRRSAKLKIGVHADTAVGTERSRIAPVARLLRPPSLSRYQVTSRLDGRFPHSSLRKNAIASEGQTDRVPGAATPLAGSEEAREQNDLRAGASAVASACKRRWWRQCRMDREHEFRFLNVSKTFSHGKVDWASADMPKLWRYNLHYFDYILNSGRSVAKSPDLISDWIQSNPMGSGRRVGAVPGLAAHRQLDQALSAPGFPRACPRGLA